MTMIAVPPWEVWAPIMLAVVGGLTWHTTTSLNRRKAADDEHNRRVDQLQEDITRMQARLDALERRERQLWQYNRSLMDHIYRRLPPPPPAPPEGLMT